MKYDEYIKSKKIIFKDKGFDVSINELNKYLFDYQKAVVKWSIKKGKCAIFAECGMGKTAMQIEWINQITEKKKCNGIILTPLSVSAQTVIEAEKMGIKVNNLRKGESGKIDIVNYEYIDKIDFKKYNAVVLDESSILKSYTGKIKTQLFRTFKDYEFKLCCTATPSPNDMMELLNHSDFLDIMQSNKALAIWYINDTMNFGSYRLKKHSEVDFWQWVSSWAVAFDNPSLIGFDGSSHVLPKLNEYYIDVECEIENKSDNLFGVREVNAVNYNQLKRETIEFKTEKIKEIISKSEGQILIWCYNNNEADYLKKHIKGAIEVRGSDKTEYKEECSIKFAKGEIDILISKPSIFGFGMNFQNCHNVIYCGLSFSFEEYYQSLRRVYRYGQKKDVNIYTVITNYEKSIYDIVNNKSIIHNTIKKQMVFKNDDFNNKREYNMSYVSDIYESERMKLINGDSIEEIKKIENDSIDFSIFSPPFSQLYIYSDSYRDMGNCKDDSDFIFHFEYLIPELFRIMKSGRLVAIHCKNLVDYKGSSGRSGLRDFRGDIIRAMEKHDFKYHSEVCIWKDPVIEMQRTKNHGLLYKQLRKDSSYSRQGLPDYLVIFRKWTENGDVNPVDNKTHDNFKLDKWQNYASPVWFDINQTNVLNKELARGDDDEKHICPLQLDVIERAVDLWTKPGDWVFTPFLGIGSEIYQSLLMGRNGIGIELKREYYEKAIGFCKKAESKKQDEDINLFDMEM